MRLDEHLPGDRMIRLTTLLLSILLLPGCASVISKHSRTILMNSQGDRQECTVDMLRTQVAYDRYKQCIESYEEQGYEIWGQY